MRVCIIAANNIRYSPYIFFYTNILKNINVEYELIIPDRNGLQEVFDKPLYILPWNKSRKTLPNYIMYSNAIKRKLKKNKYDIIIVLTSVMATFLGMWLKRHYSGRYIVDIRDYTHENIYPYFLLERIAVENSLLNIISSQRFEVFLPKAKYYVCHNDNARDTEENRYHFQRFGEPIRIGYVGSIFYVEQCKKLMYLVSKDRRFRFDFYGTSDQEILLQEVSKELKTDRIEFYGAYEPKEKESILEKVDILFNAYGNGCPLLDHALSNKLYDALTHKKPILTSPDTYMTEMAGPLAFPIDLSNAKDLDALYAWYYLLDDQLIDHYADKLLKSISEENNKTKRVITDSVLKLKQDTVSR